MPGEDLYSWSPSATLNGNADTSINWAEGQPRASVNNSSRSQMAAHAKVRDQQNSSIVTSGTADAQMFFSGNNYTTVPTGMRVLLKIGPSLTNTGAATLNMDNIGAVAIKTQFGADIAGGDLAAGGITEFVYNGTNWIMLYSVPVVSTIGPPPDGTPAPAPPIILQTVIIDGSTTVDFTTNIDDTFDVYQFTLIDIIPQLNAQTPYIRFSENGGATWGDAFPPFNYKWTVFYMTEFPATAVTGSVGNAIAMTGPFLSNAVDFPFNGTVTLATPSSTTKKKTVQFENNFQANTGLFVRGVGAGIYMPNNNAINGIRFEMSSGNIVSGKIKMSGLRA